MAGGSVFSLFFFVFFLLLFRPGLGGTFYLDDAVFILCWMGVLASAVMMMVSPRKHVAWGSLVLLFTLFAMVLDAALLNAFGFLPLFGLALILIGGVLAIVWKPPVAPTQPPP